MTKERFYYKIDFYNDIKSIYRLIIDDVNQKVTELIWLDNQWKVTDNIVSMVSSGEFFLEEISRELVNKFTPYVDTGHYEPRQ
jgi:hypothetical protein